MLLPAVKALHHFNAQGLKYNRIIPTNARKIFGLLLIISTRRLERES